MIGQFIVAIATISEHSTHAYVCYVTMYILPNYEIDGLFNFQIRNVSVFSQSEALLCYHGNRCAMANIFQN